MVHPGCSHTRSTHSFCLALFGGVLCVVASPQHQPQPQNQVVHATTPTPHQLQHKPQVDVVHHALQPLCFIMGVVQWWVCCMVATILCTSSRHTTPLVCGVCSGTPFLCRHHAHPSTHWSIHTTLPPFLPPSQHTPRHNTSHTTTHTDGGMWCVV